MNTRVLALLVGIGLASQVSFAGVILLTSSGSLPANDSLPIGTIGADGTTAASGFVVDTTASNPVTISDSGANGFSVLQQSNDWSGNFTANDLVLWTGNVNTLNVDATPVTLSFGSPVQGIGTQVDADALGSFTATISAYDSGNNLLGQFTEPGTSSESADNSAIFLGVLSDSANISSITIGVTSNGAASDFAFNELAIDAPAPTPEPSSLGLTICAGALAAVYGARRLTR